MFAIFMYFTNLEALELILDGEEKPVSGVLVTPINYSFVYTNKVLLIYAIKTIEIYGSAVTTGIYI